MHFRRTIVALACLAAAGRVQADFVSERWGQGERCRHRGTIKFRDAAGDGKVVLLDLSALPKGTRVYRARLLMEVHHGPGPLPEPILIHPVAKPPDAARAPLKLVGPRFRSLDATGVVRRWVGGELENRGLWVRNAQGWRHETTCLEISYEGKLKDPPPPVTGLRVFHRAGQAFLTFDEVANPFARPLAGKQDRTWDELRDYRQKLRNGRVPRVTYRIYRHTRPITPRSVHQATPLDEVPQFSALDERQIKSEWKGERIKNVRVGDARVPRVCVEPLKELPLGTGVFVRTSQEGGDFYYAAVSTIDGVENTVQIDARNSLAEPLHETVARPEPILHHETKHIYDKPRGHRFYLLWADPPLSNVPNYYHLGVTFPPERPKEPRPVYVQAFWWDNGWARSGARRAVKGCVSLQMETPWVLHKGIHEGCGTYKAWSQGSVQDYWVRRLRNILPWLKEHYNTDADRRYAMSSDWAWHHPDLFAAVHENLTTNPRRSPTAIGSGRFWGRPRTPASTEWGISAWDYYDIAGYLKTRVDFEIPLVYYTPNMHEGDFGFIDKPRFYRAMLDTRRAFIAAWHMNVDASWIYTIRRTDTLAAFSNCSLDADPGIGMGDGDREGQINGYLRFDPATAVDEPGRWEMTLWLHGGDERGRYAAPADSCTVDVTPRRCQQFKARPGEKFKWRNVALDGNREIQAGTVTADKWGLTTIEKLVVTRKPRRVRVTRVQ